MKILVTGATGFVGRYFIAEALRRNHQVIALSRNREKARQFNWFSKVQFIEFDIDTEQAVPETLGNPDVLVHLAWSGLPNYKSLFHIEINLPSSMRFIRSMVSGGVKHVLVTGTCFEFGMQNGGLSPDIPTFPDNPYGIAKDTLRKWLEKLHAEFDFIHQWARLFYMFGEGQNEKSILSQLNKALDQSETVFNMSGGEQLRDYLPVEKVAEKLVNIAEHPEKKGTMHCCSGTPVSIRKLVENHLAKQGRTIKLNLGYYSYPDYEPLAFWGIE